MLETMRRRTRALIPGSMTRFPSLLVTADELRPQGAFAEAQAQYLLPDQKQVWEEVGQGGVEELSSR